MGHTKLFFCKCENKGNMNKKPGIIHVHTYTPCQGQEADVVFLGFKIEIEEKTNLLLHIPEAIH